MKYTPTAIPSGTAGGDLSGTYPDPTIPSKITSTSNPQVNSIGVGVPSNNNAGSIYLYNTLVFLNNYGFITCPADGSIAVTGANTGINNSQFEVNDGSGIKIWSVVSQATNRGGIASSPLPSQAPTTTNVAFGTAWHNTNAWDVTLQLVLDITANTSLVISAGIGTTTTPTQQTLVTGVTTTGFLPLTFRVPAGYYLLLSESGTGTVTIIGQQQFNN